MQERKGGEKRERGPDTARMEKTDGGKGQKHLICERGKE